MFSLKLPKFFASRVMRPLALLAIAALAAPGTALATSDWTSAGSTGTVDELCSNFAVQMEAGEANLFPGIMFACKIRFQVTDTFGTAGGIVNNQALFAHIRDTSATGNVMVRLFEYRKATGATTLMTNATIDSNNLTGTTAAGINTQYRSPQPLGCAGKVNLDFAANSYWIEVEMTPGLFTLPPALVISYLQLRGC